MKRNRMPQPECVSKLVFEDKTGVVGKEWELEIHFGDNPYYTSFRYAGSPVTKETKTNEALRKAVEKYVEKRKLEGIRVFDPQSHNYI